MLLGPPVLVADSWGGLGGGWRRGWGWGGVKGLRWDRGTGGARKGRKDLHSLKCLRCAGFAALCGGTRVAPDAAAATTRVFLVWKLSGHGGGPPRPKDSFVALLKTGRRNAILAAAAAAAIRIAGIVDSDSSPDKCNCDERAAKIICGEKKGKKKGVRR